MIRCRLDALADLVQQRVAVAGDDRLIVGICGPPGAGKSTLAARLAHEVGAMVVPMDGFHLPNAVLDERGLNSVKGAPETFDASSFVAAVTALRRGADVALPAFDRTIDEPTPDAITVGADECLVVVEGNYLLLHGEPWSQLGPLFDLVAYVDLDDAVRRERLVERHVEFGRDRADAERFVLESDEKNAALVAATRSRADVIVTSA